MRPFSPTYALSLTNADSFDFLFNKSSALLGYLFPTSQVMGRRSVKSRGSLLKFHRRDQGLEVFFSFFFLKVKPVIFWR